MGLTFTQSVITFVVIAIGTFITRLLPFLIFREGKPVPAFVSYLGKVLPPAMMGLLVVYCLKDVNLLASPHGLPELIAITAIVLIHKWKGNTLVSIGGGTVLYMFLVQVVFI